jgi:methyl-accepting chemotaxis protein
MRKRLKINLQVVGETLLLLSLSLGLVFYFSHKALKNEALLDAEQTLEGTVQDIDNILLSVEQATGNIYYDLLNHVNDSSRMYTYCRELVEGNPNIVGCAIAYKPGYFPGKDLFMVYVHRRGFSTDVKSDLVTTDKFTNRPYTEQVWFTEPMNSGYIGWTNPLKGEDTENVPLETFCLPFTDASGERVGMIGVDVSINQLSKIILAAKPSEHSYSVLLARNGSFIVHPDEKKLESQTVFSQMNEGADPSVLEAAEAMVAGETGTKKFKMDNQDWMVFYKPFKRVEWEGRSQGPLGWSVGVVYHEDDVHGVHNKLLLLVIGIAIAGMLLFFLLCNWIIRMQLKPLRMLTRSAQRIAEGDYSEIVPDTNRDDEIGHLQNRFHKMQRSLQSQVDELEQETEELHHDSDILRASFGKTEEADRMRTSFLHYMTNQMALPSESIDRSVTALCNNYHDITKEEIEKQVTNIERKSETLVELLNHMSHFTEMEEGKEADHE